MAQKDDRTLLLEKLADIFQLDRSDLDFGIYRILNIRAKEIRRFLDDELIPQVCAALDRSESSHSADLERELEKTAKAAREIGTPLEASDKYQALLREKQRLERIHADKETAENEVYSHLYNFFGRYFREGDFQSLRRYQKDVYALPYEGEEVKMHWANRDQYYIKSSERFGRYAFVAGEAGKVVFEMAAAETERDNNKEQKARCFSLADENPVLNKRNAVTVRFQYRGNSTGDKQEAINAKTATAILESLPQAWRDSLGQVIPTGKNQSRTLLDKHLAAYTAKNTFDYFIHKDLRGFLRRELDFFIKNEVVRLDDITNEGGSIVTQYLGKVAALREVGYKLIDFLAQLEDFQKALWEKRKFVLETQWCITLDRVAATPAATELLAEIAGSKKQQAEWKKLFDFEMPDTAFNSADEKTLANFASNNPQLVVDTSHFGSAFKEKLLANIEDIDTQCDGVLVHGDNFQALNLLFEKYRKQVKCIHIDPPYNTDTSGFLYKNDYRHSSWLTMMENRVELSLGLLSDDGIFLCHIDENEYERLHLLCDSFDTENAGCIIWDKRNPMGGGRGVATQHEYVLCRVRQKLELTRKKINAPAILKKARALIRKNGGVSEETRKEFAEWMKEKEELSCTDKAFSLIDDDGRVFRLVHMGAPEMRADPKFHKPIEHPVTKKPCHPPPNGWSRKPETITDLIEKGCVYFGEDENRQPSEKYYLDERPRESMSSIIPFGKKGKTEMKKMGLEFAYCHHPELYQMLLSMFPMKPGEVIVDFFAGSGTTADAVINLNRKDNGQRKYLLVEMGEYFDDVLLPRVKKAVYAQEWKDGKPAAKQKARGGRPFPQISAH